MHQARCSLPVSTNRADLPHKSYHGSRHAWPRKAKSKGKARVVMCHHQWTWLRNQTRKSYLKIKMSDANLDWAWCFLSMIGEVKHERFKTNCLRDQRTFQEHLALIWIATMLIGQSPAWAGQNLKYKVAQSQQPFRCQMINLHNFWAILK